MPDVLKPQDVLVALKLCLIGDEPWSFTRLSKSLGISVGGSHNAVTRLLLSRILYEKGDEAQVSKRKLLDFLVYGVPAIYYPIKEGMVRGVPTAIWGPPLDSVFLTEAAEVPMVWPVANGKVQGIALLPIYETAPKAAAADAKLYELLTLIDVMRVGRTREKKAAADMLEDRIVGEKQKGKKVEPEVEAE